MAVGKKQLAKLSNVKLPNAPHQTSGNQMMMERIVLRNTRLMAIVRANSLPDTELIMPKPVKSKKSIKKVAKLFLARLQDVITDLFQTPRTLKKVKLMPQNVLIKITVHATHVGNRIHKNVKVSLVRLVH